VLKNSDTIVPTTVHKNSEAEKKSKTANTLNILKAYEILGTVFDPNSDYGKFLKQQIISYVVNGEVVGGTLRMIIENCIREVVEMYEKANEILLVCNSDRKSMLGKFPVPDIEHEIRKLIHTSLVQFDRQYFRDEEDMEDSEGNDNDKMERIVELKNFSTWMKHSEEWMKKHSKEWMKKSTKWMKHSKDFVEEFAEEFRSLFLAQPGCGMQIRLHSLIHKKYEGQTATILEVFEAGKVRCRMVGNGKRIENLPRSSYVIIGYRYA